MSTAVKSVLALFVVLALAVGVWLVRPLFVDTEVDEAFPEAAASAPAEDAAAALPLSGGAEVPADMTADEVEAEMVAAAAEPAVEATDAMPASGPTAVVSGDVQGADDVHNGMGEATVFTLEDGSNLLRFEQFEVTNGPELHVYLAPLDTNGVPDLDAGAVDLGGLKGNIGNQNYAIPAGFDVAQPLGVVIYCQPFHVTFATAVLS